MDGIISYLNTDLDLIAANDLTELAAVFEANGIRPLHVTRGDDGLWYATFETDKQYAEPAPNIAAILGVVEALSPPLRSIWDGCSRREFDIGYDCGIEPWGFNQALSVELLERMSAAGASLRVTLYPDREPNAPNRPRRQTRGA